MSDQIDKNLTTEREREREYEFLLMDRSQKIQSIVNKYGEENFYVSFSGGKDSTVLSWLVDYALPDNKIPRVFADTGIELKMVRDFALSKVTTDERFVAIKPSVPITAMLKEEGYPFKSKAHAKWVWQYQTKGMRQPIHNYLHDDQRDKDLYRPCPKILRYQFTPEFNLKVSDHCCLKMKEEPLMKWQKEHHKTTAIVGVMREEGGRRQKSACLMFSGKKLKSFQPMVVVTKDWEDWLIDKYDIDICPIYKPPYNFERTGCKGCPFALHLQNELDVLEKYFPKERKQAETIWKPVYDEYRRIHYRLK